MLAAQVGINLLGPPTRMALAHLADLSEPTLGSPPWRVMGTPRAVRESATALRSKTSQPFESGLSTDPQLAAELGNRLKAAPRHLNKALSRFQ